MVTPNGSPTSGNQGKDLLVHAVLTSDEGGQKETIAANPANRKMLSANMMMPPTNRRLIKKAHAGPKVSYDGFTPTLENGLTILTGWTSSGYHVTE